jgi:hypothetical protein
MIDSVKSSCSISLESDRDSCLSPGEKGYDEISCDQYLFTLMQFINSNLFLMLPFRLINAWFKVVFFDFFSKYADVSGGRA